MQHAGHVERDGKLEGLAEAAAGGDADALGELYEQYVDAIYRFIHVRTQDHARTEDVCSEVWIKVVRSIGRYQASGNGFPAWLYTIARNALMDSYRRGSARPETPTSDMLHLDAPSLEVGPDEAALRREVSDQLATALARLPQKHAQCVTLRFFDGLTIAETASVMETTIGNVKVMQHRALKVLAKVLPEEMRILGGSISVNHVQVMSQRPAFTGPISAASK